MLNPFPDLLILNFFAPTLLRVAVALILFYTAYQQYQRRDEISKLKFPVVGANARFAWLVIAFNAAVGGMLFFGYYTQIAALLAIAGFIKGLWLNRRFSSVVILPRSTILILIAVCLSLLISGAGALAFDLPL